MIKICSLTPFTTNYSIKLANSNEQHETDIYNNTEDPYISLSKSYIQMKFLSYIGQSYIMKMNESDKKMNGLSLDDILLMCSNSSWICDKSNDFEYYFDKMNGNCYRYNSGRSRNNITYKINQPGIENGLQLQLLIEPADKNENLFSFQNGYQIFITDQNHEQLFGNGIQVLPGYSTNIILKKQIETSPPKPHTNCTDNLDSVDSYNSEFYKRTISSRLNYLEYECKSLCLNKFFQEYCQCSDPKFITYYDNVSFCLTTDKINCQLRAYKIFLQQDEYSKCDCPKSCKTTSYFYSSSVSEFPTKSYYYNKLMKNPLILKMLNENKSMASYDDIRKMVISVNIFYNELTETWVTAQIKTDISSFISNIGGILGLFLGKI